MKKLSVLINSIFLFSLSSSLLFSKPVPKSDGFTDDSFTEELIFPFKAEYEELSLKQPDKWGLWSRTEKALTSEYEEETGILACEHTGEQDYSISITGDFKVQPGEAYMIASNIYLPKGDINACFVLTNKDGKVIDWSGGETKLQPANGYQVIYSMVYIDEEIDKIRARFIGNGITSAKIKNTSVYKIDSSNVKTFANIENEDLRVSCNVRTLSVEITDKRNNQVYQQASDKLGGLIYTEATTSKNNISLTSYNGKGKPVITMNVGFSKDNPATLDYSLSMPENMDFQKFSFPQKSISKEGDYLVLPINEGMCFDYNDTGIHQGEFVTYSGHGLCMPFFGITNQNTGAGFISIIKDPDDCAVDIKTKETNCLGPVWKGQKGKFGYSRHLSQTFLTEGGHVAIAKEYRKYAIENGTLVTFEQKKQQRGPVGAANIDKLMGAVNIWSWYYDWNNHTADMFVKKIIEAGIDNILWSNGQRADVVAGINELGALTSRYDIYQDVMDPKNYDLVKYIHGDWVEEAFPQDIAVKKDGTLVQAWPVERKDGNGFVNCVSLCDVTAPKYARKKIAAELEEKDYSARFFDTTTASALRECYSSKHPMTRTESRKSRFELLSISSLEHGLVTGSETGMDFVVPVCDYFEGMMSLGPYRREEAGRNVDKFFDEVPSQITEYQLNEKRRLPLWELVYHDCCVAYWYWGDHNNTFNPQEIWDKRDDFNALYAVPPMYWFYDEKHFEQNKDRFLKSYRSTAEITKRGAGTEMISHEFVTPDRSIQRTRFANGLEITVDFNTNQISYN